MPLPGGAATRHDDLAAAVARIEAEAAPRWVLSDTAAEYPPLLEAGARLDRCRDLWLSERIISRAEGREPPAHVVRNDPDAGTLFERAPEPVDGPAALTRLQATWLDQRRRLRALGVDGLGTLLAAESAGGLAAAEMSRTGIPFDLAVHDRSLRELLGPRPAKGMRPRKLQALADQVTGAFGHRLNPDSTKQVLAAFHAAGVEVRTTHHWELSSVDHPAVEALRVYREHARVWTAFGWNWADTWVGARSGPGIGRAGGRMSADALADGAGPGGVGAAGTRFRPVYTVGGTDTGRWATGGGGALQLPRAVREAIRAEPGWKLVAADAAQLEPRLLAAISGDEAMIAATAAEDLYAELAPDLGGERSKAKIALISAMYGGTSGDAAALVALMRERFPAAAGCVERAARTGEKGGTVRTWLGRTAPVPSPKWWSELNSDRGTQAAGRRGRFTRNFIVQGTAAEWALVLLALLRRRLHEEGLGELVFYLHDEVMVHCPTERAPAVCAAIAAAAAGATRTLFGDMPVRIPLRPQVVDGYAEAR